MSGSDPTGTDSTGVWPGVWLGVDVGTVRVGVARSDPSGTLATPVETVPRDVRTGADITRLAALVAEHAAVGVVVGLPRTLRGRDGESAHMARAYAAELSRIIHPISVELSDERFSTVTAERRLSDRGVRGPARRAVIDQAAAVEILQQWLDLRSTRSPRPAH